MMAGISGKNTTPEIRIRKALHRAGFRFRLHSARLPGKPDIILPMYQAIIFVHGCFWHRHEDCHNASVPKSNATFWKEKFARNVERDSRNMKLLQSAGWRIGIVWECAVRARGEIVIASELARWLKNDGEWFQTELPVQQNDSHIDLKRPRI